MTFRPRSIPSSSPEVPNSMRGQYSWLGQEAQPTGWPISDVYYRDQVPWGRIEPTAGSFDLDWFEAGLAAAEQGGGRFGFRVLSYCPGCWFDDATPPFVPMQPGTDIPDWNSEAFLSGWERLMDELGNRYDNDPRMGWVDVGGYGSWGEWHVSSGQEITDANAARVIRAVVAAFPSKHVVINAMTPRFALKALKLSPRMGLRVDCLGEYNMFSALPTSPEMQQRWRTAPVLSEWCGTYTTSTTLGARQVRDFHISQTSSGNLKVPYAQMSSSQQQGYLDSISTAGYRYGVRTVVVPRTIGRGDKVPLVTRWVNTGSAPTYDDWDVELRLGDRAGRTVATRRLDVDLGALLPGGRTYRLGTRFPKVAPGTYALSLAVTDPSGYLAPMNLAIRGRSADGSYALGRVRIVR
ncbi:MAG: DUF4832 domain-containing protein [Nocardioides sp.]